MAGHRRTLGERSPDGSPPPTAAERGAAAVKVKLQARYAEASDARARVAVAVDYVRAAAARARRVDPTRTEHLLEEAVRRLLRTGDELLAITTRGGSR